MKPKIKYIILLLGLGIANCALSQAWYSSLWLYRKSITIDFTKVSNSDQSTFPMLVNLISDAGLAGHAQSTGNDILFTSNDGMTKIAYERELYTTGTGALVAWVQVPTVSHTANTVIYMYYGNAGASDQQQGTATWSNNYAGVWHLKEATAINPTDATSNGFILTQTNSPVQTTAVINGGLSFNGATQYAFRTANATSIVSNWTLEAWINPGSLNQLGMAVYNGNDAGGFGFGVGNGSGATGGMLQGLFGSVAWINTGYTFGSIGTWYHVVMKRSSAGTTSFYVNGTQTANTSASLPNAPSARFTIGNQGDASNAPYRYFNGVIDEVRISSVERTADWVKTEYNNQSSPSTFYSVQTEQTSPVYTWNHSVSTDWQVAGNWTPSRSTVTAADVLQFTGGGSVTVTNVPTQTIGQLLLTNSSTVNLQPASTSNTLSVTDALTTTSGDVLNFGSGIILAGTITTLTSSGKIQTAVPTSTSATPVPPARSWGGTFEYNGSAAQTAVAGTYITLKINNAAGVTLAGAVTLTNLTIGDVTNNSILSDNANQITGSGSGTCSVGTGSRLNLGLTTVATATTFPASFTSIVLDATSIIAYQANLAQTISNVPTYGNVILNTGASATIKTAGGALTLNGSLTISATTTFAGGTSLTHNIGGDWTNNGSFTYTTTSTINLNGNNASNIYGSAATTFYNLTVNKGAAATTVTSSSKAFTVSNNLTITQGNLILQASDVSYTITNDISVASNGTLTHSVLWQGPSYVLLNAGGNISVDGIFTYTVRSHVQMTSSGTKTIRSGSNSSSSFSILTFTNGGTFNASGTLRVDDNFWVMIGGTGGSFHTNGYDVTAKSALLNGVGTMYVDGGSLTVSGGGINVGNSVGNGAMVISSGTVTADALNIGNGTQTGTLSQSGGTITITGNLLIYPSCTYTCSNSPTINLAGNWTNNNSTAAFTTASSTVYLNGSAQSVLGSAASTFYNLTMTGSGLKTLTTVPTINNILSMEGTATCSAQPTYGSAATLQYKGSAAQTTGPEFSAAFTSTGGVIINNSNGVFLGNSRTINPSSGSGLTLTSGRFSMGFNTLTLGTTCPITGTTGSTNMIVTDGTGGVLKNFATTPATFTFPVGTTANNTAYSPLTLTATSGNFNGNGITVRVSDTKEGNIAYSNYLNRYWSVTQTGSAPTFTISYIYDQGDVTGTETALVAAKWNTSWTFPATSSINFATNTVTVTGQTSFSDWTAQGSLTVNPSASPSTMCYGTSTTITANASGGTAPLTYSWNSGQTTPLFAASPVTGTTYMVVVTDNIGSSVTGSVNVIVNPMPAYNITSSNITCFGNSDGTITITATNGSSPFQFSDDNGASWLPGDAPGYISHQFTGLAPNTPYKMMIKDNNGCKTPFMH